MVIFFLKLPVIPQAHGQWEKWKQPHVSKMWDVLGPCQSPGSPSSAWKHWPGQSDRQDSAGELRYRAANTSLLLEPSLTPRSPASSVLASTRGLHTQAAHTRLHTQAGTHLALNQKVAQLNALSFRIPVCRTEPGMRFCGGALQPAWR